METREIQIDRETRYLRWFQSKADAIVHLIVNTDMPWVDVAIQIEDLRRDAEHLFPHKMNLFELIFVRRFERLWNQWRRQAG